MILNLEIFIPRLVIPEIVRFLSLNLRNLRDKIYFNQSSRIFRGFFSTESNNIIQVFQLLKFNLKIEQERGADYHANHRPALAHCSGPVRSWLG